MAIGMLKPLSAEERQRFWSSSKSVNGSVSINSWQK